jgi:hypothetical protein
VVVEYFEESCTVTATPARLPVLLLTVPEIDQAWTLGLRQATRPTTNDPEKNVEVRVFRITESLLERFLKV